MKSYSQLQQELILSNAKLDKMTSTVKQLGTKLKKSNEIYRDSQCELIFYKGKYNEIKQSMIHIL